MRTAYTIWNWIRVTSKNSCSHIYVRITCIKYNSNVTKISTEWHQIDAFVPILEVDEKRWHSERSERNNTVKWIHNNENSQPGPFMVQYDILSRSHAFRWQRNQKLTLNAQRVLPTTRKRLIHLRSYTLTHTPCSFIVNTIQTETMNDKIQYKLDRTHSWCVESVHATHRKKSRKKNSKG